MKYSSKCIGVVICLAIPLFSFKYSLQKTHLISSVKINEDSAVIHHFPLVLNIIDDSLVGFAVNPITYCIWNYQTGAPYKKININDSIIKGLVSIASNYSKRKYIGLSKAESKTMGIPIYEIYQIYTDWKKDISYLLFGVKIIELDTEQINSINHKDSIDTIISTITAIGKLDSHFNIQNAYYINNEKNVFCNGMTGFCKLNNCFYAINNSSSRESLITKIVKKEIDIYSAQPSVVPVDSLTNILKQMHSIHYVTFQACDSNLIVCNSFKFYDQDGLVIYKYNDTTTNETINSFIKLGSDIIFHCVKRDNSTITPNIYSSIYVFNINKKVLSLINQTKSMRVGNFYYKNKFICITKKEKEYYFDIYSIN